MIANEIKDEKKIVATFLTTIGSKTYNVLRDLLAPEKPSAIRLEDLVLTFKGSLRTETNMREKGWQRTVQSLRNA